MDEGRRFWLHQLLEITTPVLEALEREELKTSMPLDFHDDRARFAPLEAFGRSLDGLSGWLSLYPEDVDEEEQTLLLTYKKKAARCIAAAVRPDSRDRMIYDEGGQPLVDTAFLAHAVVRAPGLLEELSGEERGWLAAAFRSSRSIMPGESNWLLFSAMVEAGLFVMGEPWDRMRVLYPLRMFRSWYLGDGTYGDGAAFHWDYYNSFVIQPMCVDLVELFQDTDDEIKTMRKEVLSHAQRYAEIEERLIGLDGSFPVIGRSACYRFGAFQLLAQMALRHLLPETLSPAGVRCALHAVIERVSAGGLFDEAGWLRPGVAGDQPELAEPYINVGSLYLCTTVFLPLGLRPEDPFWSDPEEDWTSKKIWSGGTIRIDHAKD